MNGGRSSGHGTAPSPSGQLRPQKHVGWLADAILDAARSDSLRKTCQAFGLKREKEIQTRYGKEKESRRDCGRTIPSTRYQVQLLQRFGSVAGFLRASSWRA